MSRPRDEIKREILNLTSGATPPHSDPSQMEETSVPTDSREGKQFGAYRILKRLGSGGMGQVYLALDTRLGRHTALKFLPQGLLADRQMLGRLEQEARTASALNHPNILTIYEIGEQNGELFIASEFIDGITLKKAIQRQTLNPEMAIRVGIEIASALKAAHEAGVIHRDLKPANVMVRPDGYVKVIDFGLAKLKGKALLARGANGGQSWSGSVVGTVHYMSPEQARGDEVDERTDLWSLGVLLFEMLTNQRPFAGQTDSHVIVAILDAQASPLPNVAALPRGTARVIGRLLAKDPLKRYQSAQEVIADLQRIEIPPADRRLAKVERYGPGNWRFARYFAAALTLILLSVGAWWQLSRTDRFVNWFRIDSPTRLTFHGRTLISALSPDGKFLAFVVGETGGLQSLWIRQLDQPEERLLIGPRKVSYSGLTFSPDSLKIYEVEEQEDIKKGELFTVPVLGGRSKIPLLEDVDGPVAFAPSGREFAFVRYEQAPLPSAAGRRSVIETASLKDLKANPFYSSSDSTFLNHVAWSPDGRKIAVIVDDPALPLRELQLALIDRAQREALKILPAWNSIGQLLWDRDGRSLLLTATSETESKSQSQVRQLGLEKGTLRNVTNDLNGYRSISMTQSGDLLAAVKVESRTSLWISALADWSHGKSAPAEMQDGASLGWLDENQIIVNSHRTGVPNLDVFDARTQAESVLTNEGFLEQSAVPVPGGRSVVYSSNRWHGFHIWRYDFATERYTQLSFGSSYDNAPVVTPDGKWVVYTAWTSTDPRLYKVPVAGGPATEVGSHLASDPQISPDGRSIACLIQRAHDQWEVSIVPFDGTGPIRPVAGLSSPFRWSPSGDSLTSAISDPSGVANLWQFPLDGSTPRKLTEFEDQAILTFAWSPDGTKLAAIRLARDSDVVLFKRQRAR